MGGGAIMPAELPSKIGRHSVLGYLADGGMAEIFLGKEPEGRPVVIKRILPHLARQGAFVSMFIDEARIGSLVKHPNVVEVYELGQVGSDLFMVMEYLAGESASGLLRRIVSRGQPLPLTLATYIVAEACAGLHAAHTLLDESGQPVGLVHRDISPSNLFITYTGDVKVLDFGIATAADRLTRTATGQVKGKFSYMSPEQCRGEPLDLRSDLFSLGVVLYELTTQRRLFKRANELMVLKAVTEGPIPPPSREIAGYPEVLERICMKALSRDRDLRHASALELRNELLAAMTTLGFGGDPRRTLAHEMEQLFDDRIAEKRLMLRHVRMGTDFGQLPAAEVDENIEVPQVAHHTATAVGSAATPPVARTSAAGWIALVLVLLGVAGAAVWWFGMRPVSTRAPVTESVAPPVAMPVTEVPPPEPAPAPNGLMIRIETIPAGALLTIDGTPRGETPMDVGLDEAKTLELEIALAGYVTVTQKVDVDRDQRLLIPLAAEPAKPVTPVREPKRKRVKRTTTDAFERFD